MQTVEVGDFATVLRTAMREGWGHPEDVQWTPAALAAHVRINTMTVRRWTRGDTTPFYKMLEYVVTRWTLTPPQRRSLFQARDRSDHRLTSDSIASVSARECAAIGSNEGIEIMKRRDLLYSAGALVVSPVAGLAAFEELSHLSHAAERYKAVKTLAELVGGPYVLEQRLAMAEQLERACLQACEDRPNRTNHLLVAMAGCMRAIGASHVRVEQGLAIAMRARQHADQSGQNVARLWSATAEALCHRKTRSPRAAIEAIERVMHLPAERGTMPVFAASVLAESYGDLGDGAHTTQTLALARRLRDETRLGDEFGGLMTFPVEQEMKHVAGALLNAGEYADAIQYASQCLAAYESMPLAQQRKGYMQSACLIIATAATRLGWFDEAETFTQRALQFPSDGHGHRKNEFRPLLAALTAHHGPSGLRATVEHVVAL